jgi:hypothetical protein
MDAPSSHSLASVSQSHTSSYTFYAKGSAAPYVAVRQTCTEESDGNANHFVQHIEQKADGSFSKGAEPKISFSYGIAPATTSANGRTTIRQGVRVQLLRVARDPRVRRLPLRLWRAGRTRSYAQRLGCLELLMISTGPTHDSTLLA